MEHFDVIVVGGGHAGCEAAWISSQFDQRVCLISMPNVELASTPCNPSVGGVGKGHVVRELDALGGLMGRVADLSAIQYRRLNDSKGYAVHSTRVQVDKSQYTKIATEILSQQANLSIILAAVSKIEKNKDFFKIDTVAGQSFTSTKLIMTTGTFLNGKLHSGSDTKSGGRVDCSSSSGLTELFGKVRKLPVRFKTGTPPRLKKSTINFDQMEIQESDPSVENFHWNHSSHNRFLPQVNCHLTRIGKESLDIIRSNRELSPLFNGQIQGVGPRYCPSIEDKAFRYPDRHQHHVFVEPESHELETIYPNGISTSLPLDIQEQFIRKIPGLERAEILIPGYAVEYDVVDTSMLDQTLQYKDIPGLYFAGQVNGTSGYEEAAGQGFVAGVNASLALAGKEPLILSRNDSYIGVMVDDLISAQRDEPYRLFTARAENRLYLREDNTLNRMHEYRKKFGLNQSLDLFYENFMLNFNLLNSLVGSFQRLHEALKNPNIDPVEVLDEFLAEKCLKFDRRVIKSVSIAIKYDGYVKRSQEEVVKLTKLGQRPINWSVLIDDKNVSFECKLRIEKVKPINFHQLSKIEGIRPATLVYVAANIL